VKQREAEGGRAPSTARIDELLDERGMVGARRSGSSR